jgi:hypothetical protein
MLGHGLFFVDDGSQMVDFVGGDESYVCMKENQSNGAWLGAYLFIHN